MRSISRNTALKIIWSKVKQRGWDREELYMMLEEWKIYPPRLSQMSTKQMSQVLTNLGEQFFVKEPRDCSYIRELAVKCGRIERLGAMCKKLYGKSGVHQLDQKQRNGLKAVLRNYAKDKKSTTGTSQFPGNITKEV